MSEKRHRKIDLEWIETGDGSMTLRSKIFNTTFHSINGAITERTHIFIEHGLHRVLHHEQPLRILELGFGTGLNTFLTFKEAVLLDIDLEYVSYETHPIDKEVFIKLDYSQGDQASAKLYKDIYNALWNEEVLIHPQLRLSKIFDDISSISDSSCFHCVYFDPFAADIQPELWALPMCELMYQVLKPGGVLVTWSVKGSFRRALSAAGFLVQKIPGPAGKREITFAIKTL